jgi:hypothetical protein
MDIDNLKAKPQFCDIKLWKSTIISHPGLQKLGREANSVLEEYKPRD